ncbi:MAG: ubiquinol-cytochrome c reductase iron-sulfur subunit [Acidimicrobiia bacterium]|jgi:cytochrome b6-f complex iron-sulfur subunit|nr:ubiquinol-cytochrome c reductase iron-sulfur subunit [Acidimicrobiia bacterium]MBP8179904.1 ubiquinol-cytochrome c reductase iron-sulfur subunit [Acidimicrobiia bacterium]
METPVIIAITVLVFLGALALAATARRRDAEKVGRLHPEAVKRDEEAHKSDPSTDLSVDARQRATETATALATVEGGTVETRKWYEPVPRTEEEVGVTRRQFFNRAILLLNAVGLGTLGLALIAFLDPVSSGGFGSQIDAGSEKDIKDAIESEKRPFYVPEGRFYVVEYPSTAISKAKAVYEDNIVSGMESGYVALYQKCPHLGCRVPFCLSSQWFECPCHGSKYNRVGEKRGGPAPRGMDRFPLEVTGGKIKVNTGVVVNGPAIGTDTTGQEAEGPNCV